MATYKPLQSITLTSNASSITFSSISQDYTDLVLVSQTQQVTSSEDLAIRFNNDSTSVYSRTYICGDGSTAHSGRSTSQSYIILDHHGTPPTSTSFGSSIVNIPNYSNTTLNKTVLNRNGSIDSPQAIATVANVGLWRSTSAITSITVLCTNSSNLKAGSTFDLYGIKAGTPKAIGGDITTTDGTYWYHAFKSTGVFTVQQGTSLSVDYLVIAGGGGGGSVGTQGGGGGAGGLRSTVTATGGGGSLESAITIAGGSVTPVIVGAGGEVDTQGSNSSFSTITSTGGGRGGHYSSTTGGDGGSGGGAGAGAGGTYVGGSASPSGQGYAGGGSPGSSSNHRGGGGGGAGAVGATASTNAGAGGAGVAISAFASATGTGVSNYYAGGGGGGSQSNTATAGAGGSGGGGSGAKDDPGGNVTAHALPGTANTGGGGGGRAGSGTVSTVGRGGSGLVIVRYPV
jgi:hypothetical protein